MVYIVFKKITNIFNIFLGLDNTLPPANPIAKIASDPAQNDDITLSCEFRSPDMNGTIQSSIEWFIGDDVVEVTYSCSGLTENINES